MRDKSYVSLSAEVERLELPSQAHQFIRRLRQAVSQGVFRAAYSAEFFPKPTRETGKGRRVNGKARNMIIESTPAYQTWFDETKAALTRLADAGARRSGRRTMTLESVLAGEIDFDAEARKTREQLLKKMASGRELGASTTQRLAAKSGQATPKGRSKSPLTGPKSRRRERAGST